MTPDLATHQYRWQTVCAWLSGIIVVTLMIFAFANVAWGHAHVAESTPADGDVLDVAPSEIEIVFTEPLEPAASKLQLVDDTGNTIENTVQEMVDDSRLRLAVPELPPGSYVVRWSVLSRDGHTTSGEIRFSVSGFFEETAGGIEGSDELAVSTPVEEATADIQPPTEQSTPVVAPEATGNRIPLFAVGVAVVVLAVLLGRRRK